jgi:hypothetical protein
VTQSACGKIHPIVLVFANKFSENPSQQAVQAFCLAICSWMKCGRFQVIDLKKFR